MHYYWVLLGTKCSDAFLRSLNLFHFHVDRDIRQLLENLSLLSVLQQESFPFNCQGSIKLFNVLISVEWRVGEYKKEFFHFNFCVKFRQLFQPTSVTPGRVHDGLEGWSTFSGWFPKAWEAVGLLVADAARSARGFAFCSLSRMERESLPTLPWGRNRLSDLFPSRHALGTEQLRCRLFFLKVISGLVLFHGVNNILEEIALWPSPLSLAIKRHHYGNHLHGRITLGKAVCIVSSL